MWSERSRALGGRTNVLVTLAVLALFDPAAARTPAPPEIDLASVPGASTDWWTRARENLGRGGPGATGAPLMNSPQWSAESNQAEAEFGFSVAPAGDVNADGFSDVIVGAPRYDNGQTDEGRVYVFHGSAAGLSLTPNWTAESNQAGATFGFSVGPAGDVNGDGFDDVIIGANAYDNGQTDEGRASVYHGSAIGLAAAPSWMVESNQAFAYLGHSAATAGDVNGDGYADVIVGVIYYDNGEADEGRAYVYHGSATGLGASPAWTAEADRAHSAFGSAVATAGDVNGDGYADVIVGAAYFDNGQTNEGRAYAYHGSTSGLAASPAWVTESNEAGARLGESVGTAGDVNGDGYADVIVGAPYTDQFDPKGTLPDVGLALVYPGSTTGLQLTPVPTPFGIEGAESNFGSSVATAGDVNGDGFADVIVGAPAYSSVQDRGQAFVLLGSASGGLTLGWSDLGAIQSNFGASVATAGDVNGDGFSDIITGAPGHQGGQADEGGSFVYHGSAAGLAGTAAWIAEHQVYDDLGYSVATAGDVNGDGYSDVIVGVKEYFNGEALEGAAFVYHGSAAGLAAAPSWTAESNLSLVEFGFSVATAGDVDGDGFSDVIIGAYHYRNGENSEGRAFVYHGSPAGLAPTPGWTAESNQGGAWFGYSVATAGDVNGDGFSDVIVGAPLYDEGENNEGRAFVYHGSAVGLATTPAWTAESNQAEARFGSSVAAAGDVNGDGFSDVIVGVPLYDNGELAPDVGWALVYHGSTMGLAGTAAWSRSSSQVYAEFGNSVATAGDVNGDGFSDVIVGAHDYDGSWNNEGSAFVYHGSSAGLATSVAWSAVSSQPDAEFGISVATAGDVNGDGFSDVLVGAHRYDNVEADEGRAFVYHGSAAGLATNPAWTGESNQNYAVFGFSAATAGDVNGDGFPDVIVGAYLYDIGASGDDGGRAFLYYSNGDGLERIARQMRTDDSAPIALLGKSDSHSAFRLKTLGRTPAGRGPIRIQFEVKPDGIPFDGTVLATGSEFDTGAPSGAGSAVPLSLLAGGLTPQGRYRWRLRTESDSPFFPRTPWISHCGNAPSEIDLRTAEATTAADVPVASGASSFRLEVAPNPFGLETQLSYTMPQAGWHRVTVYDMQGREVAVLAGGTALAGRHRVRWDGRGVRGERLATGTYFIRLEVDRGGTARKVGLVR